MGFLLQQPKCTDIHHQGSQKKKKGSGGKTVKQGKKEYQLH